MGCMAFSGSHHFYSQRCAKRKAPVLVTQRPILRFFALQGRHIAPMGVKFGTEEGTAEPCCLQLEFILDVLIVLTFVVAVSTQLLATKLRYEKGMEKGDSR